MPDVLFCKYLSDELENHSADPNREASLMALQVR